MFKNFVRNALLLLPLGFSACAQQPDISHSPTFAEMNQKQTDHKMSEHKTEIATFAAGCFWCVEAQFQQLEGVQKVESGYTGGHVANPTYKEVCTGTTGHAEACNITYDPAVISYDELLAAFFMAHDPTQLNRQGNDIGTQYRSGIYYHNEEQKEKAAYYIKKLNEEKAYDGTVVTEVKPYGAFYKAEDYHQNYYNQNGEEGYCRMVIRPKLDKFKKVFAGKLKQ
ncbi:peptide-methionine (S)-S-oxide reductase MsrA [Taibaiella koreensis]|uniref:peptide-methionine (S)-S-oxide reductase MsrA n=1 Tax=Taibaiella koreensis TaxID=1268548 RepID=UPI000E59B784|nr:peptide-methionine (S)-S-oxide reductase MsrA [Taibaiella koreensis]